MNWSAGQFAAAGTRERGLYTLIIIIIVRMTTEAYNQWSCAPSSVTQSERNDNNGLKKSAPRGISVLCILMRKKIRGSRDRAYIEQQRISEKAEEE